MATRIEQYSRELESMAKGILGLQHDIDRRDEVILSLKADVERKRTQIATMDSAAAEALRVEKWQRVASDSPPEGVQILMKDKAHKLWLAEFGGVAGWFSGDTRLKVTPMLWMRIPNK